MAGALKDDDDTISEINVTRFVDVVLVLLVIFMVTAGFIMNKGIKVELPQAASTEQLNEQTTLNILVKKDAQILLDGNLTDLQGLKTAGTNAKQKNEKVVVMISADKGVVYSSVVGVMDTLRQVGVSDFALQLDALAEK